PCRAGVCPQSCLCSSRFEGLADVEHSGDSAHVVHPHGTEHGDVRLKSVGQREAYTNDRELTHTRMDVGEAYLNGEFAVTLLEETFEQLQNAFLFFESAEEVTHTLAGEVQVESDQIFRAFEVHLGHWTQIEETFGMYQVIAFKT